MNTIQFGCKQMRCCTLYTTLYTQATAWAAHQN